MNLVDSAECRFCMEEDEDAHHLLFDCPALEYTRTPYQSLEDLDDLEPPTQTSDVEYTPEWYKTLISRSLVLGQILMGEDLMG